MEVIAGAVAAAVAPQAGLTIVQRSVLNAMCEFLLGNPVDLGTVDPISPQAFAEAMRPRGRELRTRIVQAMLLGELLLVPLPATVSDKVEEYAARLGVNDDMMRVTRELASGSLSLALIDFERSGYFAHLQEQVRDSAAARTDTTDTWALAWDDDGLYEKWAALEHCPEASLGHSVWRFYTARGFVFPGRPSSAPPMLAQHDWVHVLADYGSTVESEIEVFALIARANDDPRAFSLLAMVIGLFETGYLPEAASGFFRDDRGHLSRDADRMGIRLADAMTRGKSVSESLNARSRAADTDLLAIDWFAHADRPIADVRVDFCLGAKSVRAIESGSVGPWAKGGISAYQYRQGEQGAVAAGHDYDSFGAMPPP